MSSRVRELFGGALTSSLPGSIIDARSGLLHNKRAQRVFKAESHGCRSDLRQIPDTQEVFLFPDSDVSIIFEILEIVQEGAAAHDLQEAVKYALLLHRMVYPSYYRVSEVFVLLCPVPAGSTSRHLRMTTLPSHPPSILSHLPSLSHHLSLPLPPRLP